MDLTLGLSDSISLAGLDKLIELESFASLSHFHTKKS